MVTDKIYDYVIYSANPFGIIAAMHLSQKGKRVLVLSYYGFMGGSISESLNCMQSVHEKELNPETKYIFESVKNHKHGILYQKGDEILINPELIKIVLQKYIEQSKLDLLFHIVPFKLTEKEEFLDLSLSGKEGIFNVRAKTIIDASEDYELVKIINSSVVLRELYYNMFLTNLFWESWQNFQLLKKIIKLDDGRYWVSLEIPKPENEYFIENHSQKIINEFEDIVQKCGGRINVLAPQTQKVYSFANEKLSDNNFHIDSLLSKEYKFWELFSKTSDLENKLSLLK